MPENAQTGFPAGIADESRETIAVTHLAPTLFFSSETGSGSRTHSPTPTIVSVLGPEVRVFPGEATLVRGDVAILPSTTAFHFESASGDAPPEVIGVDINFRLHGMEASLFMPDSLHILDISGKAAEKLQEAVRVASRQPARMTPSQLAGRIAAGYQLASLLMEHLSPESSSAGKAQRHPDLQAVLRFLHENYPRALSVEDIASACHMSRRKLFNVAAASDGSTPMRLLMQIRLQASLALLRDAKQSIGQVSASVGFADPQHFSRSFSKHYGFSPLQYRQRYVGNAAVATWIRKAEEQVRLKNHRRAADLYTRAARAFPNWSGVDELRYKAGRALYQAGDPAAAEEAWRMVATQHYRLQISLDQCKRSKKPLSRQATLGRLREVYREGNEDLRTQMVEWLTTCLEQSLGADDHFTARQYADLAREVVGDYPQIQPVLARALFFTDATHDLEAVQTEDERYVAGLLRASGRFEEHLKRFPHMRTQCASLHLRMGHTQTLLADYTDIPECCVRALCVEGRYQEAVERFPNQNGLALLALGRHQEVLDQHSEDNKACMWALAFMGRMKEALRQVDDDPELMAQLLLYLGRPGEILSSSRFDETYHREAALLQAIQMLMQKQYAQALVMCDSLPPMTESSLYSIYGFYMPDLLVPLIQRLLPQAASSARWPACEDYYSEVLKVHRYCHGQKHWYAMRRILGEIDDNGFLSQPNRLHAELSLHFIKGLAAECLGKTQVAEAAYRASQDQMSDAMRIVILQDQNGLFEKAFARWRLKELAAEGGGAPDAATA